MRFLRLVTAVSAVLCLGQTAADAPDERKLAEELLALTQVERTIVDLRAQVGQMMTAQLGSMDVPEGMRDKLATFQKRILDMVFEDLSFAKMKPDYIEIYASTFTRDELAGLVEFYKSPVGRAFSDKMPVLLKRTMEMSQARMQTLLPRIKKMNEEFMVELQKGAEPQ